MAKTAKQSTKELAIDNQRLLTIWLFAIGALVFLGGLWAWYQYVYKSPYNVFWSTIDNSLNIYGVTRTIEQDTNGVKVNQKSQLSLGAQNTALTQRTIIQPTQSDGEVEATTETLSTPTGSFTRYTGIVVPGADEETVAPALQSLVGQWSRDDVGGQAGQNQFTSGIFGGAVPFSDLTQLQRQELVQFIKDEKVYTPDYASAKTVDSDGKQAIEYEVTINTKAHLKMLVMLDEMLGLGQFAEVDVETFDEQSVPATITSSINGRQLLKIDYGNGQTESFSGYGAHISVELPETNILREDLEQKIQEIFTPAAGA